MNIVNPFENKLFLFNLQFLLYLHILSHTLPIRVHIHTHCVNLYIIFSMK